jgi:hypothetical protein
MTALYADSISALLADKRVVTWMFDPLGKMDFSQAINEYFGGRSYAVIYPSPITEPLYDAAIAKAIDFYAKSGWETEVLNREEGLLRLCNGDSVCRRILRVALLEGDTAH